MATYSKYACFMSVLKESEGICSVQGKGIRWYGAPHLRQALQVTTAQGGEGDFFSSPPAKVFNLVKPEGLSRCLIIKGVWTKGYSKPAGATNWTFSSVFDGWLPSEIVCFLRHVSVKLPQKTPRDPRCLSSLLKKDILAFVVFHRRSNTLCLLLKVNTKINQLRR